ncbi:MAG TPA: DNA-binding response regulator [Xanthobacteraceae bacterium]|nr:DNA-binding response regulator [Xanthobacteraceae bacterium]
MPIPLRKQKPDGTLYQRRLDIERSLGELLNLSRSELGELCKINDPGDPHYLAPECLLHVIRTCRSDNSDRFFETIFRALRQRILARMPNPEIAGKVDGKALASQRNIKIGEYVMDRFMVMLAKDRAGYDERLDYFEVNFDAALATLRLDGRKKAFREEKRSEPMTYDDETSELNAEIEEAAAAQNPLSDSKLDDPAYRSRLYAAIDSLPDDQRRVMDLQLRGFQIDSKEPGVQTIAQIIGCAEKTVRNRRDRAYAAIRKTLGEEQT